VVSLLVAHAVEGRNGLVGWGGFWDRGEFSFQALARNRKIKIVMAERF